MSTLIGRVVCEVDRQPLPYAIVVVLGMCRGAIADEQGWFRIENLRAGSDALHVQSADRSPFTRPLALQPGLNARGDIAVPAWPPPDPVEIGTRLHVLPGELMAIIRPGCPRFVVGEFSAFDARIVNRSAETILLVSFADGSWDKASPRVTIAVDGPHGVFAPDPASMCGNTNGIGREHFTEVGPGQEFDPYRGGWSKRDRFVEAGVYRATFRYVTSEPDPRKWMAQPSSPGEMPQDLRGLFTRVPAVDLSATVTFRVHER